MTLSTYRQYFHAGGSYFSLILMATNFIFAEVLFCCSDYWLSIWTNAEHIRANLSIPSNNSSSSTRHWMDHVDQFTSIYVYSALLGAILIVTVVRAVHFFNICISASVTLHNQMLHAVMRAPLLFFERNPVGMPLPIL